MAKSKPRGHVSKPVYPGGTRAMRAFVKEHLHYPEPAREAKIEGTVVLRYSLDYTGKVVAVRVKRGIGHGCDEEAMRVVRLLQFRVPQDRKRKVRIHQDIRVQFKLPEGEKQAESVSPGPTQRIVYSLTESAPKPAAASPGGGYRYTINY